MLDSDALATWDFLNSALLCATEEECWELIIEEMKGRRRKMYLLRIHSRVNVLRAYREREEILAAIR